MAAKIVTKKIVILSLLILVIILAGWAIKSATKPLPSGVASTYAIGDTGPAGGIIFITPSSPDNPTGKYFEAAPADLGSTKVWCSDTATLLGASGTAIGTGAANTAEMLLTCTSGAAFSARAYSTINNSITYSDWFLPSQEELNQLCKYAKEQAQNRSACTGSSAPKAGFVLGGYWSSSEYGATNAWLQSFNVGSQDNYGKVDAAYVRPVRAFS